MPAARAEAARKTRDRALSVGQRRAERHGRQLAQAESAVWHHSRRRICFSKHCRAALAGWKSLPIVTANTQAGIFPDCRRACVSGAAEKAALFFLPCPLTFHLTWRGLREDGSECGVSGGSSRSCTTRAPKRGCLSASAVVRLLPCLTRGCNTSITCEM